MTASSYIPGTLLKSIDGIDVYVTSEGKFKAKIGDKWVTRAAIVDLQRVIEATATTKDKQIEALHIGWGWSDRGLRIEHVRLTAYRRKAGTVEFCTLGGTWIGARFLYVLDPDAEKDLTDRADLIAHWKTKMSERIDAIPNVTVDDFKNAGVKS